jgi:uncharacterized protein YecE (DUF72 family)
MEFWIGTSGFQYAEWKGKFYPEDLPASKMLPFYSERFSSTEVNYTFHRIPSAKTIENWKAQTPPVFRFSLKAPQKVTHWARLRDCGDTMRYFHDVTSALGDKRGIILFQLPPNFKKDTVLLADFVNCLPTGLRAAFEFRHESWFADDVYETLKIRDTALCIADMEEITTPPVATASFGYLRLRREDYSSADVKRWSGVVQENGSGWSDAYIYFKHEEAGIGPKLAAEMKQILAG